MEAFSNNLRELRKAHKMNQKALGEAVGVGQTTIANYEKGSRFPTGELLKSIAEVLNVSIDTLMGHEIIPVHKDKNWAHIDDFRQVFTECLVQGREQEAVAMIWELAPNPDNILDIYERVLGAAMIDIGHLWARGEVSVATEHYASQTVHKIMAMLSTIPAEAPKYGSKAVAMSLSSDSHTIGIKMISECMNLMGIQSRFIGTEVPVDSLVEMLLREKADILALSVTMPYHVDSLRHLIATLRKNMFLPEIKIIVGGQAFGNNALTAESVGADVLISGMEGLCAWIETLNNE